MKIHNEDITLDTGLIKEDYVHRVRTLLENRQDEMLAVAQAEYDELATFGLTLEPSIKLWEAPLWVDAQFVKSIEQLVDAEEKNPDTFWGKKATAAAEEAADENEIAVVRTPAEEKRIKQLISEFKKKTDKIVKPPEGAVGLASVPINQGRRPNPERRHLRPLRLQLRRILRHLNRCRGSSAGSSRVRP
jgi:DNA-directed RNA polymerase subunit beta'